jgi:ABC-type uncharacterized transport system ATPase subunit
MIEFSELSKSYGAFCALAPLILTVPRGEMFGFLGLCAAFAFERSKLLLAPDDRSRDLQHGRARVPDADVS